jgi:MinD-like ATPase involved in chromosome partitioning or flagellar assembly
MGYTVAVPKQIWIGESVARIIAAHSFRGGAGATNIVANIASILACQGLRVAMIDADLATPGLHLLFGLNIANGCSLSDYLWGACDIEQAAHDLAPYLNIPASGRLFLVPASMTPADIARILREGYDIGLLNDGFHQLIEALRLDVLVIDTHAGLREETLLSLAVCDALAVVMRPDAQDEQGTQALLEAIRPLDVPLVTLIANHAPQTADATEIERRLTRAYRCAVAAVIPHCAELMALANAGVFALRYPDHPVLALLAQAAAKLMGATPSGG